MWHKDGLSAGAACRGESWAVLDCAVLLGKAKIPVIWDLSSACNKCFVKCLYLFGFFSFLLSV